MTTAYLVVFLAIFSCSKTGEQCKQSAPRTPVFISRLFIVTQQPGKKVFKQAVLKLNLSHFNP